MEPDIVFAGSGRLIIVLHAMAAIVLIGATTHHALIAIGYLRGNFKERLARIYATTTAVTYAITFALGLVAYPSFRYHVRALYLDRYEPGVSNLFDIKENFAALGVPLVIAAFVLSRVMKPKEDKALAQGYAAIVVLTAAIVWFAVISGLVISLARGM
ncbi:MAG: hypothetical protein H0T46_29380 [Deltaproteobacteria bacterium]|nr:hypothetical protein [Deltaproteobacteria bacterium]